MSWTNLPTDHENISWDGMQKYNMIQNQDGTVSLVDMTEYTGAEKAAVPASEVNQANGGINDLMGHVPFIGQPFSEEEVYSVGDKVVYQNALYKFINAHAGTWNPSDVEEISIGDLAYQDTVDYETQVTNKPDFAAMLSGSETSMVATRNYNEGELIGVGDTLYKALNGIGTGMALVVGSNVVVTTIEAEVNAGLNTKANAANVYTKTETDEMLYTKAPVIENTISGNQTITDGADGIPAKEVKIVLNPMQEGSGTPTPENVRPVTPYTKLNFAIFGKNWLPAAPAGTWTQNGITFTSDGNGGYTYIGKSTAETSFILDVGEYILPASGYIHLMNSSTSNFISFGFAYNGTALDPLYSFSTANRKVQLNNAHTGMKANQIIFTVGYNINVTALRTLSPMVMETNTVTPFTPYGKTISVDWEDKAGTVYSGIYDVMTGILTVDSARVMLADLAWTENAVTEHAFDSKIPDRLAGAYTIPEAYSNIYKMYTAASLHNYTYGFGYGTGIILYVKDDRADTPADMVQLFQNEGTYIVYKLASPVTYPLDPALFKTVYGENHIWTDVGSPEVTYRADTKLYIEKRLSELINQ